MASLVERLRKRAEAARRELTATALGDALHFEEAADRITALEAMRETLAGALEKIGAIAAKPTYPGNNLRDIHIIALEAKALTQYRAMKEKNDDH